MKNPDRKLILLLWTVIAVLLVGATAAIFMLVNHANTVDQTNSTLSGNNDSLKRQVDQAREQIRANKNATPTPAAIPTLPPSNIATPTPAAKATTKP